MGKEYSVKEALQLAIRAEMNSRDFYRHAASLAGNERTRQVFTLLAGEEEEHLAAFCRHYEESSQGDLQTLLDSVSQITSETYTLLKKAVGRETLEQKALELALREEQYIIEQYSTYARDIVDPQVRVIFERVIRETRKHYELIEAEYAWLMGMVHDADQDIFVRE